MRHYLQAFGGGPQELRALTRLSWKWDCRATMLVSVRAASLKQSPLLDSAEFEDALVALCLAYLQPVQASATMAP